MMHTHRLPVTDRRLPRAIPACIRGTRFLAGQPPPMSLTIGDLPDATIIHIMSSLSSQTDLLVAGQVCRRWRRLAAAPSPVWRDLEASRPACIARLNACTHCNINAAGFSLHLRSYQVLSARVRLHTAQCRHVAIASRRTRRLPPCCSAPATALTVG